MKHKSTHVLQTVQKVGQCVHDPGVYLLFSLSRHAEGTFIQGSSHRRPRRGKNVDNQTIRSSDIFSTLSRNHWSGFCS